MFDLDIDKFKELSKKSGKTKKQIATYLTKSGIKTTESTVKSWTAVKPKKPETKKIKLLSELFNVHFQDLILKNTDYAEKIIDNPMNQVTLVSLLDGYIGAGSTGIDIDGSIIDHIVIDKNLINKSYKNGYQIWGLKVIGESMIPYISPNDIVLYIHLKQDTILEDGVYVISTPQGVMVKNITYKINGDIIISSSNKEYPSETISNGSDEMQSLNVVGKVVGRVLKN